MGRNGEPLNKMPKVNNTNNVNLNAVSQQSIAVNSQDDGFDDDDDLMMSQAVTEMLKKECNENTQAGGSQSKTQGNRQSTEVQMHYVTDEETIIALEGRIDILKSQKDRLEVDLRREKAFREQKLLELMQEQEHERKKWEEKMKTCHSELETTKLELRSTQTITDQLRKKPDMTSESQMHKSSSSLGKRQLKKEESWNVNDAFYQFDVEMVSADCSQVDKRGRSGSFSMEEDLIDLDDCSQIPPTPLEVPIRRTPKVNRSEIPVYLGPRMTIWNADGRLMEETMEEWIKNAKQNDEEVKSELLSLDDAIGLNGLINDIMKPTELLNKTNSAPQESSECISNEL